MSQPTVEPIVLDEYGEATVELSDEQERVLRTVVGTRVSVTPTVDRSRWRLKASSYVGTVVVPGLRLLVRPKVSDANLFHLLEPSGEALDLGPEQFEYGRTRDLLAAFATFYARQLEQALARGIVRLYAPVDERLMAIRGRLDLPGQRRSAGLALPAHCSFDEYSIDTQLNRILRAAAVRMTRLPGTATTTRQALIRLAGRLDEAGDASAGDLRTSTTFTRLDQHCQAAERLARMALDGTTLEHRPGTASSATFMVDMNRLFESFVEARLRHYLIGRVGVVGQRADKLDTDRAVTIKPDLTLLAPDGSIAYVADAKYKLLGDGIGRESDYYQLLAYTTALGLDEGLLIYCHHDGTVPAREIVVRHGGQRLRTRTIGLQGRAADLEQQMKSLADDLAARVH